MSACNDFIYTENLEAVATDVTKPKVSKPVTAPRKATETTVKDTGMPKDLKKLFKKAIGSAAQGDDWASLSVVGSSLRKLDPEYDANIIGPKKLLKLAKANPNFIETQNRISKKGKAVIYIRLKANAKAPK